MSPVPPVYSSPALRRLRSGTPRLLCRDLGRVLGAALVVFFLSAPLASADENRFERPGSVGLAYVAAFENFDHVAGSGSHIDQANGGTIWLSYRFNQWVASVTRAEVVDGFDIRFGGNDAGTILASGYLGVRVFPLAPISEGLDDRIEPYLETVLGIGWGERDLGGSVDQREVGFVARFSAGVSFWLTESIGLDVGALYHQPTGELQDWAYYGASAGLQYRF